MDYIKVLSEDLEKGYSKADLERLIGLPKNNLSGILKGDRKLSKKSQLKIEKWMASEKPNPLEISLVKEKVKENDLPKNKERILAERNTEPKALTVRVYPLTTKDAIPRLEGESSLDYRIRCAEINSNK